jgi:choline transport protein
MAEKSLISGQSPSTQRIATVSSTKDQEIEHDALRLAEMGYVQDLRRKFSVWSLLAVGFSLTNSWFGISAGMVTGINSGGPVLLIYGLILLALVSVAVGMTLAELSSAYPNAGGQYFWAKEIASPRYAAIASYLTGWTAWCGSIFTSASISLAMGSAIVGLLQLMHPEL